MTQEERPDEPEPGPADGPGEGPVELLAREELFRGRIFDVVRSSVRLPSGLRQELEIVEHAGAVCVAPLLPSGELLLVRQYRHAAGGWLEEVPAGRIEPGEDPEAAVRRELEEETGHRAARWELATRFYAAPGFCTELMHLYLAEDLEEIPGGGRAADDDEELALVRRDPRRILAESRDAKTLVAAALVLERRGR